MSTAKIAISLEKSLLSKVDKLVRARLFPSRSKAIQTAVEEKIIKFDKIRLAKECAKLDPSFEQALADEGINVDVEEWPKY